MKKIRARQVGNIVYYCTEKQINCTLIQFYRCRTTFLEILFKRHAFEEHAEKRKDYKRTRYFVKI